MLHKVKQYGLEKFAGDEVSADEFVEGFVKASMATATERVNAEDRATKRRFEGVNTIDKNTMVGSLKNGLTESIGKGFGGLLISSGIAATGYAVNQIKNNNLHTQFLQSLEQAIASNRILKEANREKVKQYADTIFRFAPNVASDVNLLNSILANAVHGEGIDPMTIKTLTELENRFSTNTGVMGSIKSFL